MSANEVKDTDQCAQTYCHEFSTGSNKLSETEQEVFFCGQNLSQLQSDMKKTHEAYYLNITYGLNFIFTCMCMCIYVWFI